MLLWHISRKRLILWVGLVPISLFTSKVAFLLFKLPHVSLCAFFLVLFPISIDRTLYNYIISVVFVVAVWSTFNYFRFASSSSSCYFSSALLFLIFILLLLIVQHNYIIILSLMNPSNSCISIKSLPFAFVCCLLFATSVSFQGNRNFKN